MDDDEDEEEEDEEAAAERFSLLSISSPSSGAAVDVIVVGDVRSCGRLRRFTTTTRSSLPLLPYRLPESLSESRFAVDAEEGEEKASLFS